MNDDVFNELAEKLAKNLKTEKDVSRMTQMLTKITMERALQLRCKSIWEKKRKGFVPPGIPDKAIPLSVKSKKVNQSPYSNTAYL